MNKLITIFGHNTVIEFSEADHKKDLTIRIAVKSHFAEKNNIKRKGVKYYMLNDKYEIASEEMTQSWDALEVWFKIFKKYKVIGVYNFNDNNLEIKYN